MPVWCMMNHECIACSGDCVGYDDKLRAKVRLALIRARQNGFNFSGWTDEDVAKDLNRYAAEFNYTPHAKLVKAVAAFRTGRTG